MSRKVSPSGGSLAIPLMGIIALLASWVVLSDWSDVPVMINHALAAVHWPA